MNTTSGIETLQAMFLRVAFAGALICCVTACARAQSSPHGRLGLPCESCHVSESWTTLAHPMQFDHDTTAFPLRGQHRDAACRLCHATLRFDEAGTDCFGCHRRDYAAAVAINHAAAGFSTTCTDCHEEAASSWLASFDHDRTDFPLRGIHESLTCATCHARNRYRGTPAECVACHVRQYAATTAPNHQAAHFNTDCATCHRALTWQPAAFFPHDQWFPIGAGAVHSPGRWNSCADCHAAQPNYAAFECINCHEHNKASTDNTHRGRDGYVYLSSACYRCHPQG